MKCPSCGANISPKIEECAYCGEYIEVRQPRQNKTMEPKPQVPPKPRVEYKTVYVEKQPRMNYANEPSSKNLIVALVLSALGFIGFNGLHRFYVGKVGKVGSGIVYLLTFGWFMIGTIIDILTILTENFKDPYGRKLTWGTSINSAKKNFENIKNNGSN